MNVVASAEVAWTFEHLAEGLQGAMSCSARSIGDDDVWCRRLRFYVTAQFDAISSSAPSRRVGVRKLVLSQPASSLCTLTVTRKKNMYNYR